MRSSRHVHIAVAVFLICPAALALSDVTNQRVSKQAPPQSGCVVPSADTTVSPSDGTVYLYFEATQSDSDHLTSDWIALDGTTLSGGSWSSSSGRYCFTGASLGISNRLGPWQARVLNNGSVIFSVPFTISNPTNPTGGAPTISDANPKSIPIGAPTTITLTGTGFQSGLSGKLWVGSTPWPLTPGSQAIFDGPSQVRLIVQVGQPNDPTTAFGLQIVNPDGSPSNTFTGLTATQSSTGGGGTGLRMTSGWYWPTGSGDFCGYFGWLKVNSTQTNPYHLGQDMCNNRGNPIYAIGPGSVIDSRTDVGGYGPNYTTGGALVARHQAADGTWFTAVYGHLDNPHAVGTVNADEILGYTNDFSPGHLHFGLHPGYAPEPTNPWRGYTDSTSNTYGFTDPIPFLNAHPLTGGGNVTGGGAYPESPHPYSNNYDNPWTYTMTGNPAAIAVTFDSQTQVEQNYDYIYVMDGNGNGVAGSPFTGTALAGRIVTVPGSTVKIRLTSDYSVVYYGFRVTNVAATSGGENGGDGGLYQPGDGASDPNPWVQAFYRNQFNAYSVLPADNRVSPLGPGCIQYFKATDTQQKTEVLMQRNCTGTVYQIYGGMWNKYTGDGRLGGPTGSIGYPTNDRQNGRSSVDGQAFEWQEFQTTGGANTRIVQYNSTAYAVFAGILNYWASQGYENSKLGIPTSEEFDWGSNGCKRQNFQNGWYVWWSSVPGGTCNGN